MSMSMATMHRMRVFGTHGIKSNIKNLRKRLQFGEGCDILHFVVNIGPSPNGKATDSDSVTSRFESLWASYLTSLDSSEGVINFLKDNWGIFPKCRK